MYDTSGQRTEITEVSAQVLSGSVLSTNLPAYMLEDTNHPSIAHALDLARDNALDPPNRNVCLFGYQRISRVAFSSSNPGLNLQVR